MMTASESAAQIAGRCSTDQQETIHERSTPARTAYRKRSVFGGQENRQPRQMHGSDQAGARQRTGRRAILRGFGPVPGSAIAGMRPSKPVDQPASIRAR